MTSSSCAQRGAQFVLYTASIAAFAKTFYFMMYEFPTPIAQTTGSHFQYLTILGLSVTFFGQFVGLAAVLANCNKLRTVKQYIDRIAAPVEFDITVLYWAIKMIDPALLIDPRIAVVPPLWLDFCMHVLPSIVELIDVVFFSPRWNMSFLSSLIMFVPVGYGYWEWTHFTYSKNGFFPYPLLGLVDVSQRIQIYSGAVVIVAICQQVLRGLQRLLGPRPQADQQKKNA